MVRIEDGNEVCVLFVEDFKHFDDDRYINFADVFGIGYYEVKISDLLN